MANIIPYREFLKRKELREQETGITLARNSSTHPCSTGRNVSSHGLAK